MKIKVITIDFWNTIFDYSGSEIRNEYRKSELVTKAAEFGKKVSNEEFDQSMEAAWKHFYEIWHGEQRTPQPIESLNFLWKFLGLPEDKDASESLVESFGNSILKFPPAILPGVKDALEELSVDYKLGIVSDTGFSGGNILRELKKRAGILDLFVAFSYSDETGVSKPHPKAFKTIIDKYNCAPKNAIHIGDIEQTDVNGAVDLGMQSIRFNGDTTKLQGIKNPEMTAADIELTNWADIVKYIKSFSD
ncbi:MAG: HAD family hydrolase [Chlorobi bacterium]|nr:HAD family hydrolase [Chlorobiota bacterium]